MKLKNEQLCCMNLHYQHYTLDYFLDGLLEMGIQSFELWAGSPHLYAYEASSAELRTLRRKICDRNLEAICLTPESVLYPFNIAEADSVIRERSVTYMIRSLECTAELGIPMMLLTPGWGNLDQNRDEATKYSLDSISRIVKRAEQLGITMALEHLSPISSNLLNTSKHLKWYLDQIGSVALKGMVDTCQVCLAGEHIRDYFKELGEQLIHIHIVDGTPGGHLAFGDGEIPLQEFVNTAEKYHYQGMFSMEISDRRYFADPRQADRDSIEKFKQWLKASDK